MPKYALLALVSLMVFVCVPHADSVPPQSASQYPVLQAASSTDASFNWAGYVATQGAPFSGVSAMWIVPKVASASERGRVQADAAWVGLGGVEGDDLLQAGTQAVVSPRGDVTYEAWVEALPDASHPLPLAVSPGDEVSVVISQRGVALWDVRVQNVTTGKEYEETLPYESSASSAEWIEEMPSTVQGAYLSLDNFDAVRFVSAGAVQNGDTVGVAEAGAEPVNMISRRGEPLADTSVLDAHSGFSVTRALQPLPASATR